MLRPGEPRAIRLQAGPLALAAWEWEGEGPPVLLVHATGFHGRCWDAVARRLPGRRVLALDMPSHGASDRKPPPYDWAGFGDDLARAIDALAIVDAVGVGHSMGGHALVLAAAARPGAFRGLLLVDPVIAERGIDAAGLGLVSAATHPVARRRNRWESPRAMAEAFAGRDPYSRWDREVLDDYCRHGLRPTDAGDFELACPPQLEAEVYVGMQMRDVHAAIPRLAVPVDVVRARDRRPDDSPFDFSPSPTWPRLASCFARGRDEHLADCSHFIPMERPGWTAARIAAFADALASVARAVVTGPDASSTPDWSRFGERFAGRSGIVELMDDLGSALRERPGTVPMGGGNPACVPAAEALYRERIAALLSQPGRFHAVLGSYQPPQGDEAFRVALAATLQRAYGWEIGPGNVAVANGSQSAFFVLFNLFAGDFARGRRRHVLLPMAPEYVGYRDVGAVEGLFRAARPVIEPLPDGLFKYRLDPAAIRPEADTAAICVSRPTNPTGNVLSDGEMAALDAIARERGVPLIVDGAYGTPFPQMIWAEATPAWNANTVLVLSLSKLGLPGLRTGIVIAREEIAAAFARATTVMNLACGSLGPALAADLLSDGALLRLARDEIRPFYAAKARRALESLREGLAGLPVRIHRPEGAMFLWLWFEGLPGGSRALYRRLKERGVLVVPGNDFFIGLDEPWGHADECLRVSYAQPDEAIDRGVAIIAAEARRTYGERSDGA